MKAKASPAARKIRRLEAQLARDQERLATLKRRQRPEPVADYILAGPRGPIPLSRLFAGRRDLIVIHNMGRSCVHCTLWADGFNGIFPHLANRAGFAVVSPDSPAVQRKFARSRGWRFPLYSAHGSSFIADLGFMSEDGPMPGVSTFRLVRGKIFRIASAPFGSFDPFCSVWPLFALLADGVDGWNPRYRY
jgi:predicted dithiol-disulfide oxidoreductase (DUF899 family)